MTIIPSHESEDAQIKRVTKEALDEWLEKKYATVGKWTLATLGLAAFGAIIYALLYIGWRPSI